METATSYGGREDQAFSRLPSPPTEDVSERRIKWDFILRRLGLHPPDASADDTLLNQHHPRVEVNVLPSESQHLADPQTGTHCDDAHGPVWLPQKGDQLLKLLRGEDQGFLTS